MALNDKDSDVKKKPHEMPNAEYVSKLMGKCIASDSHDQLLFFET